MTDESKHPPTWSSSPRRSPMPPPRSPGWAGVFGRPVHNGCADSARIPQGIGAALASASWASMETPTTWQMEFVLVVCKAGIKFWPGCDGSTWGLSTLVFRSQGIKSLLLFRCHRTGYRVQLDQRGSISKEPFGRRYSIYIYYITLYHLSIHGVFQISRAPTSNSPETAAAMSRNSRTAACHKRSKSLSSGSVKQPKATQLLLVQVGHNWLSCWLLKTKATDMKWYGDERPFW